MKFLLTLLLMGIIPYGHIHAQAGKDGSITINSTNVILNEYTTLATDAFPTDVVLNTTSALTLSKGDLLLITQTQGCDIDTRNQASFGNILSYVALGNVGSYKLFYVESATGNQITLTCPVGQAFATIGRGPSVTQIIKVPQYDVLTIEPGASVTGLSWDGRKGGIVAIRANTIVLNGEINAKGLGFRGGTGTRNNVTNNVLTYYSNNSALGGEKGEGIASTPTYAGTQGYQYGRGAIANGGGGGNSSGSGGGGGANGYDITLFNINTYSGRGVFDSHAAWSLDPEAASGSSIGGGRGGYNRSTNLTDPTTIGPGNCTWGGDCRRNNGGRGGRPLLYSTSSDHYTAKLFLGGGGGGGSSNNATFGGRGGNGGGLVFLLAETIQGTGAINVAGNNGESTNISGGGGGGGGSIFITSANPQDGTVIQDALNLVLTGGQGGNSSDAAFDSSFGSGGGGSGGTVYGYVKSFAMPTQNVSGGIAGISLSNSLTTFPQNGATAGNQGYFNFGNSGKGLTIPDCTPLSANPLNFNIKRNKDNVQLNWNHIYKNGIYYIQKGTSPKEMQTISAVSGSGINGNSIQFEDAPLPGISYYRIVAKMDNKEVNSNILSCDYELTRIEIYPNPFTKEIKVNLSYQASKNSEFDIIILNAVGAIVEEKKVLVSNNDNNQVIFNTSHYPKGSYFIKIKSNTKMEIFKVLKYE